jgi:hypothetical protein
VPEPPPTTIAAGAPWRVVEQDREHLALRLGDGADGVRVQLVAGPGRHPGVSPVLGGRTFDTGAREERWPLVRVGWPDERVTAVRVETEGPDLVVRFEGPPLAELTDHPDAPGDPAIAWVRVRPRDGAWRVAATGLAEVALPGEGASARPTTSSSWSVSTRWGVIEVDTDAPRTASRLDPTAWRLSTWPSLSAQQPYPRLGLSLPR